MFNFSLQDEMRVGFAGVILVLISKGSIKFFAVQWLSSESV